MRLANKTAIIAGDAWGLGHAAALLFAREGARVVCIDDNDDIRDASTLRLDQFDIPHFHADVSNAGQVQAVADACAKTLGKVDILFNVAGRNPIRQTFEKTTLETWDTMISRNLSSAFICSQAFLPLMKKAGAGSIIHHGSIDGLLGNPAIAAYSAGKGGVLPLTHVMAQDRKSTRLNSSHIPLSRMPSSA
mgnify:FL=1